MGKIIAIVLLVSAMWAQESYLSALINFLQHRTFTIDGYFYRYDFDNDGKIDYNDWIYEDRQSHRQYRLLAIPPTPQNAFGFQPLSHPVTLSHVDGYFVYIGFDQDTRFAWLYIDRQTHKLYKLMGSTPQGYFRYLDIDGDGKADPLPLENFTLDLEHFTISFGLGMPIYAISAGWYHTCIIQGEDRHGICWGSNRYGELGRGEIGAPQPPTKVRGLQHIRNISASKEYTCASKEDGTIWCWGRNQYGKLGNGKADTTEFPFGNFSSFIPFPHQKSSALPTPVLREDGGRIVHGRYVEAGSWHGCALMQDTKVMCWGENMYGALGIGLRPDDKGYGQISKEFLHTHDKNIFKYLFWPFATYVIEQPLNPMMKMPTRIFADVKMIAAGSSDHTCALLKNGTVKCWGWHGGTELGFDSDMDYIQNPFYAVTNEDGSILKGVKKTVAGGDHTCALLENGTVKCWGVNAVGQLGNNSIDNASHAVYVRRRNGEIFDNVKDIAAERSYHTCAITDDDQLYCWGDNSYGELAQDPNTHAFIPYPVKIDLPGPIKYVAAGGGGTSPLEGYSFDGAHTCVVTKSNRVYCWGSNIHGQIDPDSPKQIFIHPKEIILTRNSE